MAPGLRERYPGDMLTVLRDGPYRFFFYSGDRDEPPHVHVERDDCEAKFWLDPVRLERSRRFSRRGDRPGPGDRRREPAELAGSME